MDQVIDVNLQSGLVSDTPLLIDSEIKSIRSMFLSLDKVYPTFALNDDYEVINSEVNSIPKEIELNELWDIALSNGYHFTCTPNTLILCTNGWKEAKSIVTNDTIMGVGYSDEKNLVGRVFLCTHSARNYKLLAEKVYYFMAKHCNILLPHYSPDDNQLNFICIHQ